MSSKISSLNDKWLHRLWRRNTFVSCSVNNSFQLVVLQVAFSSCIIISIVCMSFITKNLLGKCNDTCTLPAMNTQQICNEKEIHVLPHINSPGLFPWFVLLSKFSASSPECFCFFILIQKWPFLFHIAVLWI